MTPSCQPSCLPPDDQIRQLSQPLRAIVERLFEQALERLDHAPQLELPLTQDHPLIRPAAEYGELFTLGAQHGAEPQPPTGETQA